MFSKEARFLHSRRRSETGSGQKHDCGKSPGHLCQQIGSTRLPPGVTSLRRRWMTGP